MGMFHKLEPNSCKLQTKNVYGEGPGWKHKWVNHLRFRSLHIERAYSSACSYMH